MVLLTDFKDAWWARELHPEAKDPMGPGANIPGNVRKKAIRPGQYCEESERASVLKDSEEITSAGCSNAEL
jgi:hypothetical protein